jgi:6-phosphofructokinase 1
MPAAPGFVNTASAKAVLWRPAPACMLPGFLRTRPNRRGARARARRRGGTTRSLNMQDADTFAVQRLGPCGYRSPLANTLPDDDGQGAVLVDATVGGLAAARGRPRVFEAAGPRAGLFLEPGDVRAAIVTCGGLCPGLNDVIRAVTMVLWHRYGVREILGMRYGYEGLTAQGHRPLRLNPDVVEDIHQHGGTILGTSRGHQDPAAMAGHLAKDGINMLFTVGGDGTQRGALALARELDRRGQRTAVVGIPKTIDNDILYTERTFGFETAVAMSQVPIDGAHMEAKAVTNGVGLVKLMGRESGFVAAYAALASSNVNVVLVPETPLRIDRLMDALEQRLRRKAHAVIVVAEGVGQDLVAAGGFDASGNRKLGDIGPFLKTAITEHFAAAGVPVAVKYIDPSYTIRSARANADDSVFCFQLAENAVHAAMSGRTRMVVAQWNGRFVHVPMEAAVSARKRIDPRGSLWTSVLDNTGQPELGA